VRRAKVPVSGGFHSIATEGVYWVQILYSREAMMIQKAILVLFTLYLGTSVWVLGEVSHARVVTNWHPHNHGLAHLQVHHQLFHLHQQFHHQLFHLQQTFHSRHGFVLNFQFSQWRPHNVSRGFKVVKIPGQRVRSGRSSRWFAGRWVRVQTDADSISPTDLVPVWSSNQWTLKWKEAPE